MFNPSFPFARPTVPTRREQVEAIGNDPAQTPVDTPATPAFRANRPFSSAQNNQSSQPPPAGGLFGSSTQASQAGGGSGLFGGTLGGQASQPQQSGGLFGGSTTQNTNTGGGGLFGASTQQQPQQQSGGLGGSLFGNNQPKPGGLFGASTTGGNTGGNSLFGNNPQNTNTGGGGLLGGSTQQNTAGSGGLFSGSNAQANTNTAGGSLFGRPNPNGNQPAQPSIFGLSASQPTYTQPSLLGASQYRAGNRSTPFPGHLSMGQSSAPQQPAPGAVKYNYDNLRPTVRFSECVEQVQADLERIDHMIQMQEKYCRDIEGFVPKHGDNVEGLGRDVEYIREKCEATEQSLSVDAQGVQAQQRVLATDQKDFDRCQRVVDMLHYPQQYHSTGLQYLQYGQQPRASRTTHSTAQTDSEKQDMDITNNYFSPLVTNLKQTLDGYAANLAEIEAHMRVIEQSAVGQAQVLAARRAGVQGGKQEGDVVRELADTLRGFENSIMGAAGLVGRCREGVSEVVVGTGGARRW